MFVLIFSWYLGKDLSAICFKIRPHSLLQEHADDDGFLYIMYHKHDWSGWQIGYKKPRALTVTSHKTATHALAAVRVTSGALGPLTSYQFSNGVEHFLTCSFTFLITVRIYNIFYVNFFLNLIIIFLYVKVTFIVLKKFTKISHPSSRTMIIIIINNRIIQYK